MKILKFNELAGNTYKSVLDKVAKKGDPRSFRLHANATELRSEYYSKEPLKISIGFDNIMEFKIKDIYFRSPLLILTTTGMIKDGIVDNKVHDLTLDLDNNTLIYDSDNNKKNAYIDRKGANILSKILKDYDIDVKPQDIPQM